MHSDIYSFLPEKSKLVFNSRGCLSDGTILGNQTTIKAPANPIFKDVKIGGTWDNDKVFGEWINFPPEGEPCDKVFQSLMVLCTGEKMTNFYLNEGKYYVSAYYRSAPIIVPSNVYWHNNGEIIMLPTSLSWFNTVLIENVKNVTIDGGLFVGDVINHLSKDGEWGHGIKCSSASNVLLKNLTCSYHWGDGIDLIESYQNGVPGNVCTSIIIKDVKCTNNRRQGISIEAAHNVKVINSEFAYTGYPVYTAPGAGMDIEPWCNNEIKIRDISISRCTFHDNKGPDMYIQSNLFQKEYKYLNSAISVSNCDMGVCRFKYASGIRLNNCVINEKLIIKNSDCILFNKSNISDFDKQENVENIEFRDCKFNNKEIGFLFIPVASIASISLLSQILLKLR